MKRSEPFLSPADAASYYFMALLASLPARPILRPRGGGCAASKPPEGAPSAPAQGGPPTPQVQSAIAEQGTPIKRNRVHPATEEEPSTAPTPAITVDLAEAAPANADPPTGFLPTWRSQPFQIKELLSKLDDRLAQVLASGAIRLIRTSWLEKQPPEYRMQRRQDLEVLEQSGESPLLAPQEAVALLRSGQRVIGVLSYGWLAAGDCDPAGARTSTLRHALKMQIHLVAIFWE